MISGEPRVKKWEILVSLIPLVLVGVLLTQRNLIYSKGHYGLFTDDTMSLFLWAVISQVILLACKPWRKVSKWGGMCRWWASVGALWSLCMIVLITTGWGRYQLLRMEALQWNLGITNREEGLHKNLSSDILDPSTGPYIAKDGELRKMLIQESGASFLPAPRAAGVILAAEKSSGVGFEEIMKAPTGPFFLLASLVNEVNPQPWAGLDWVEQRGEVAEPTFRAGLLTSKQAEALMHHFVAQLPQLDQETLENLVFLLMNYPQLFDEKSRESLLLHWTQGFTELEALAVEGLVVRQQVAEFLQHANSPLKLSLRITGAVGGDYYNRHLEFILKELTLGLIRSCGFEVQVVESGAELQIDIQLSEVAHHDYRQPTYDYETYYEYQSSGRTINGYTARTRKVAKQKRVLSGYEDKTAYAPVAGISMALGERRLELPQSLLYWHHLRYDDEKQRFLDLKSEGTFGRMWPFGVHKSLFEFSYLDESTSRF